MRLMKLKASSRNRFLPQFYPSFLLAPFSKKKDKSAYGYNFIIIRY